MPSRNRISEVLISLQEIHLYKEKLFEGPFLANHDGSKRIQNEILQLKSDFHLVPECKSFQFIKILMKQFQKF